MMRTSGGTPRSQALADIRRTIALIGPTSQGSTPRESWSVGRYCGFRPLLTPALVCGARSSTSSRCLCRRTMRTPNDRRGVASAHLALVAKVRAPARGLGHAAPRDEAPSAGPYEPPSSQFAGPTHDVALVCFRGRPARANSIREPRGSTRTRYVSSRRRTGGRGHLGLPHRTPGHMDLLRGHRPQASETARKGWSTGSARTLRRGARFVDLSSSRSRRT
jgi:hypothetical protein